MEETVNQEVAEKTFTQEEVDAIVGDRLKRERGKYADYDAMKEKAEKFDALVEQNKSELQKAVERADSLQAELEALKSANSVRDIRQRVADNTGVPVSLLTGTTEEDCETQAKAILEFSHPSGYPSVRDGGEVTKRVGKLSTRDQFAEWADKAFG